MKYKSQINRSRSILFISALDLWSMGNGKGGPALWRTLTGYTDHGWKVYFITGNLNQTNNLNYRPNDNINVFRFNMFFDLICFG